MFPGYNTNGFAHHRLDDALRILADLGYEGVALTLDVHHLDPFAPDFPASLARTRALLDRLGLRTVVETGARFLLDPYRKHQPTLLSAAPEGRARRLDFLTRAADAAHALGSDALSFWSGAPDDDAPTDVLLDRLADGCHRLLDHAAALGGRGVRLAFEPEPGMFIDSLARFETLLARVNNPLFGLTIDVGHLHCLGELPIADHIRRWAGRLANVHIEDMRRGVHDHLMFGEGEIAFEPVLTALAGSGYASGVYVELSRHSHDAVTAARRSLAFLRAAWPTWPPEPPPDEQRPPRG